MRGEDDDQDVRWFGRTIIIECDEKLMRRNIGWIDRTVGI